MELVITLRKEITDREEGQQLINGVKTLLVNKPDVIVSGTIYDRIDPEDSG